MLFHKPRCHYDQFSDTAIVNLKLFVLPSHINDINRRDDVFYYHIR